MPKFRVIHEYEALHAIDEEDARLLVAVGDAQMVNESVEHVEED